MPVRVVSSQDAQPLTINALLGEPFAIAERVLQITRDRFIMDRVLRQGGTPKTGAVTFRVGTPIFAERTSEIVEEYGEIPRATVQRGDIQTDRTRKHALGVWISQEMRDRNDMAEVRRQIQVVRNTLIRDIDGRFMTKFDTAVTQARAATAVWSAATGTTIRRDIARAKRLVNTAGGSVSELGFNADTLLINDVTLEDLTVSPEFTQVWTGAVAGDSPLITGELPQRIMGLTNILRSPSVPAGKAFVLEAGAVGFYADERPLFSTELYEIPQNEAWGQHSGRTTVAGIDQPLAACEITGV